MYFALNTAQKLKLPIKDFVSKYDQIRRKLQILLHLLRKFLMENFIFCSVKSNFPTTFTAFQFMVRYKLQPKSDDVLEILRDFTIFFF